jgi:hypothetical protein
LLGFAARLNAVPFPVKIKIRSKFKIGTKSKSKIKVKGNRTKPALSLPKGVSVLVCATELDR